MAGLRVLWPDTKPSEEVMKIVEDLRQKGNFTEEELERLKLYLMSVEYNRGYLADAVLLHENNPRYSVEEFNRLRLSNYKSLKSLYLPNSETSGIVYSSIINQPSHYRDLLLNQLKLITELFLSYE